MHIKTKHKQVWKKRITHDRYSIVTLQYHLINFVNFFYSVPFTVTTNPHLRPLTTGESFVQLTCAATGGNSPTLAWSKKFSPSLSANPQKYLLVGDGLIITSVDLATDTGAYVCKGTDGNQKSSDKAIRRYINQLWFFE